MRGKAAGLCDHCGSFDALELAETQKIRGLIVDERANGVVAHKDFEANEGTHGNTKSDIERKDNPRGLEEGQVDDARELWNDGQQPEGRQLWH